MGREQENLCVCYLNDREVESDWAEIKQANANKMKQKW